MGRLPDQISEKRKTSDSSFIALMKKFPRVIIFDVDGVLVDTRHSFQRTTLETVQFFVGKKVSRRELHRWKNRPGFNDDWKLSTAWVNAMGKAVPYDKVKKKFVEIYWGPNGKGNATREKWLLPPADLRRLAKLAELNVFTGRVQRELDYTLNRWKVRDFFGKIITVEDVKRPKPAPDGLLQILKGRDPGAALYVGDNVDDALAAKAAKIPFVGILPRRSEERRQRGALLRKLGALSILSDISDLEPWLKRMFHRRGLPSTSELSTRVGQ
jgi:HAD superfamily hydrolase (TIGR01548 family)